jgi:hypothetical protein
MLDDRQSDRHPALRGGHNKAHSSLMMASRDRVLSTGSVCLIASGVHHVGIAPLLRTSTSSQGAVTMDFAESQPSKLIDCSALEHTRFSAISIKSEI